MYKFSIFTKMRETWQHWDSLFLSPHISSAKRLTCVVLFSLLIHNREYTIFRRREWHPNWQLSINQQVWFGIDWGPRTDRERKKWGERVKSCLWSRVHATQGGVTDPLRPCGPSLRPPQVPDVRLPEIVTQCRGDAAVRAVIGPLTKNPSQNQNRSTTASTWTHNWASSVPVLSVCDCVCMWFHTVHMNILWNVLLQPSCVCVLTYACPVYIMYKHIVVCSCARERRCSFPEGNVNSCPEHHGSWFLYYEMVAFSFYYCQTEILTETRGGTNCCIYEWRHTQYGITTCVNLFLRFEFLSELHFQFWYSRRSCVTGAMLLEVKYDSSLIAEVHFSNCQVPFNKHP